MALSINYTLLPAQFLDYDFIYKTKKESIYTYVEKIWGWDEEYQKNEFENSFNEANKSIIYVEGKPAGFIEVQSSPAYINIDEIHINKDYRCHGIGSDILSSIIKKADRPVRIGCFKENVRAKKLYESLGFIEVSQTNTHLIFVKK